jgi:hypothetical protein
MNSSEPTTRDANASYRAAQFEKLALHWAQRGDLRQAALALRRARLEAQTALLESYREERDWRGPSGRTGRGGADSGRGPDPSVRGAPRSAPTLHSVGRRGTRLSAFDSFVPWMTRLPVARVDIGR